MNTFEFIAWDKTGNSRTGLRQAVSEEEVLTVLREQDLTPVSVTPIETAVPRKKSGARYKKVKSADLSTFCWQLGTMLEGGLSITTAIQTIADEIENKYFEESLNQIASQLEHGDSLSQSISRFPKIFNTLSCAMITAGETSGSLTTVLERLADYYSNRDKLVRKVKGALAYPVFVVVFIVLIIIALMTFIIPRFTTMFEQLNCKLPAFTRGFMFVYNGIVHNIFYIIMFGILGTMSIYMFSKTKTGCEKLCRLGLSMPIFGKIKLHAFIAVFCKTLATLVSSGVSILDAFEILANMTGNIILRQGILDTRERMVEGESISASMTAAGLFPNVAVKMTQIGEESGSLSSVLDKTSEYYEKKVDSLISAILGMLEPILIVSVGAIVLVVILAMYLPIFSMKV